MDEVFKVQQFCTPTLSCCNPGEKGITNHNTPEVISGWSTFHCNCPADVKQTGGVFTFKHRSTPDLCSCRLLMWHIHVVMWSARESMRIVILLIWRTMKATHIAEIEFEKELERIRQRSDNHSWPQFPDRSNVSLKITRMRPSGKPVPRFLFFIYFFDNTKTFLSLEFFDRGLEATLVTYRLCHFSLLHVFLHRFSLSVRSSVAHSALSGG